MAFVVCFHRIDSPHHYRQITTASTGAVEPVGFDGKSLGGGPKMRVVRRVGYDKTYPRKQDTDGNLIWPSDAEDDDILFWVHNIVGSGERQQITTGKISPCMRD